MGDQDQGQNQDQNQGQSQKGSDGGGRYTAEQVKELARDILNSQRAEERIAKLLDDNYSYRQQRREHQNDNGSTAQLAAYQALGSVDELKKQLADGKEAQDRIVVLEQSKKLEDFAKVAGANAEVLQLVGPSLKFEVDTANNKQIPMVVDATGARTPFVDYVNKNWASLKAAIFTTSSQGDQDSDTDPNNDDATDQDDDVFDDRSQGSENQASHGQGRNLSMVSQPAGKSGASRDGDSIDQYIDTLTAAPAGTKGNPLLPASQRK